MYSKQLAGCVRFSTSSFLHTRAKFRSAARTSFSQQQFLSSVIHRKNSYSTDQGTNLSSSPVFELRSYHGPPKDFKTLLDLFAEHFHLRTRHSKLIGFWTAEIGGVISQVVHLWEYGSLSERLAVRKIVAQDEEWSSAFLSHSLPKMNVMMNSLVIPIPCTKIDLDFKNDSNAVYVLQTINNASTQSAILNSKATDEKLVGRFTCLLGPGNTEYRLWRYFNIDSVTGSCVQRARDIPSEGSSILLYPTAFSPIK